MGEPYSNKTKYDFTDMNPSGPLGKTRTDQREWDAMMERQSKSRAKKKD